MAERQDPEWLDDPWWTFQEKEQWPLDQLKVALALGELIVLGFWVLYVVELSVAKIKMVGIGGDEVDFAVKGVLVFR